MKREEGIVLKRKANRLKHTDKRLREYIEENMKDTKAIWEMGSSWKLLEENNVDSETLWVRRRDILAFLDKRKKEFQERFSKDKKKMGADLAYYGDLREVLDDE